MRRGRWDEAKRLLLEQKDLPPELRPKVGEFADAVADPLQRCLAMPQPAGWKWSPETGRRRGSGTYRMAPGARGWPRKAMATFPPASFSAITPEPITVANRKKEPMPSAASRLVSADCSANR